MVGAAEQVIGRGKTAGGWLALQRGGTQGNTQKTQNPGREDSLGEISHRLGRGQGT